MARLVRIIRQQYIGIFALMLTVSGFAAAATGGNLKLGFSNTADRPAVVKSTGNGAVLELQAKAGQPPLKVNSNKLVPKLNAALLQGKAPGAFAAAGSSYTKAQSDAAYAPAGSSYTTAESDAKYALSGAAYTKAESDGRYYTRTESDARYGRILGNIQFSGSVSGSGTTAVLNTSVSVPAAGTVLVFIGRTITGDGSTTHYLNGVSIGGNDVKPLYFSAASTLAIQIQLTDTGVDPTVTGGVIVLFVPS